MPMISFSVFLGKLIRREKCQTIRPPRKIQLKVKDRVTNYWKVRNNLEYKKMFDNPHFLGFSEITRIEQLTIKDMDDEIARKDGFDNYEQMKGYFSRQYKFYIRQKKISGINEIFTTPFDVIEFDWLHNFTPQFQYFTGAEIRELTISHCELCHTNNLVLKNQHALFCSCCERPYTNSIVMEVS